MLAFADLVRQGKVALHRRLRVDAPSRSRAAAELARELRVPLISNQPQYSMLWRVIEAEVVPTCEREGIGQIVWSPIAQGVLTGKYQPGAAAAGRLAGHRRERRRQLHPPDARRRRADRGCRS